MDNLEKLVKELANSLNKKSSYRTRNKDNQQSGLLADESYVKNRIVNIAKNLDEQVPWGEKQKYKDLLASMLNFDYDHDILGGSFSTITNGYLFLDDLGIKNIGRLIKRYSPLLNFDVKENMTSKISYLRSLGVKDLGRMIEKFPSLFGLDLEGNIKPKVNYLRSLGVKDIGKIIDKAPTVFSLDLEGNIKPKMIYLKSLGVKNIGKMIEKSPVFICLNIGENIIPKVNYLKSLGIKTIGSVIERSPMLFNMDIEKSLKPKVNYLRSLGIKDIGKMIERSPSLLNLNTDHNVKYKFVYLKKEMGLTIAQIEGFPACLGYSLNGRILPRVEYLKSKEKTTYPTRILSISDKKFAKYAGGTLQDYLAFKENFKK